MRSTGNAVLPKKMLHMVITNTLALLKQHQKHLVLLHPALLNYSMTKRTWPKSQLSKEVRRFSGRIDSTALRSTGPQLQLNTLNSNHGSFFAWAEAMSWRRGTAIKRHCKSDCGCNFNCPRPTTARIVHEIWISVQPKPKCVRTSSRD